MRRVEMDALMAHVADHRLDLEPGLLLAAEAQAPSDRVLVREVCLGERTADHYLGGAYLGGYLPRGALEPAS